MSENTTNEEFKKQARDYILGKAGAIPIYWTVCPVCPLRNICEDKESTVWKNT